MGVTCALAWGRRARWLAEASYELVNQVGEVLGHARQQLE
jgi:hypothetical protein